MQLTEKHISIIKQFIVTNKQTESYQKYLGTGNIMSDKAAASQFFKKPDVKRMLKTLTETREKAIIEATAKTYEKMYAEDIASELELDILHTKIVRRQIEVEEIFAVKEKRMVEKSGVWQMEEVQVFKKVKRKPSVLEVQRSINALYLRKGSLKQLSKASDSQDDLEQAERAKNNNQQQITERVVYLSDGTKLPMPS